MQLPTQLEAVESPAKPSKPTVIKCCFKSRYFGVVGYTEVDAKTETDFDSKIVQTDGQGQTYEKVLSELSEQKDPVGDSGGRAFQAENTASTKPWSDSKLGALEKKLAALILLQDDEKN